MYNVKTFVVVPSLPESLKQLKEISNNLWWCWNREAVALFKRLDRDLWDSCDKNPVKLLCAASQERLDKCSRDEGFIAHLDRVSKKLDDYINSPRWYDSVDPSSMPGVVAYFSAEFGIHECLPIYSGGLGILAGDHLKSASDLGVPLVGVGLLYRQGYFTQYLNNDGWQQENYPENDFYHMPLTLMMQDDGRPMRFHIDIGGHDVVTQVWRVKVGRIDLFLLDTNLRCNRIDDRQITSQLYGGDNEMRIRQEVLLGIGGIHALNTMGIKPSVCHMNEGHAAFLSLERIRRIMANEGLSFDHAKEASISGNVFTMHTPVPAGHDAFEEDMMKRYFKNYITQLEISWDSFMSLGRENPNDKDTKFSMTSLALRLSAFRNGVSELHGEVSRDMCQHIWPGVPVEEVPVGHVTNGIHVHSWISSDMCELFDRYLGPEWYDQHSSNTIYERVEQIPDEEIWRTHERSRDNLVMFSRKHIKEQLTRRGASPSEIQSADEILDPEALTIGFARRFATYKRGSLLFHDLEKFKKLITDKDRPVQIVFAGKAHPRDNMGKEVIRQIIHFMREAPFKGRVVFLENYNINVARQLVQGVDVWLNTPRRGMEASGTSGMKVLANGGINLSILDGWWCEGYQPNTGWAIGNGESYDDEHYQDEVESHLIYDLLEKIVIPMFYDRGSDKLPRRWIKMMKGSMSNITYEFSTSRQVSDYSLKYYIPSSIRWYDFTDNNCKKAIALSDWRSLLSDMWHNVHVGKVDVMTKGEFYVGRELEVRTHIALGDIDPNDIGVEIYHGIIDGEGNITSGQITPMVIKSGPTKGYYIFTGYIPCLQSGHCGFTICVLPKNNDLVDKYDSGLIVWDDATSKDKKIVATK